MLFLCSISFFAQLNSKCISNRLFSFVTRLYFEKESQTKWQAERYVHDTGKLGLVHNTISNPCSALQVNKEEYVIWKEMCTEEYWKVDSSSLGTTTERLRPSTHRVPAGRLLAFVCSAHPVKLCFPGKWDEFCSLAAYSWLSLIQTRANRNVHRVAAIIRDTESVRCMQIKLY